MRVDERLKNNTGSLNNDCFLYPSTENVTSKEHIRQNAIRRYMNLKKKKEK